MSCILVIDPNLTLNSYNVSCWHCHIGLICSCLAGIFHITQTACHFILCILCIFDRYFHLQCWLLSNLFLRKTDGCFYFAVLSFLSSIFTWYYVRFFLGTDSVCHNEMDCNSWEDFYIKGIRVFQKAQEVPIWFKVWQVQNTFDRRKMLFPVKVSWKNKCFFFRLPKCKTKTP